MNYIDATITEIHSADNINIVSFDAKGERLLMIALELEDTLTVGSNVVLGVKATSIALAKELYAQLSISNQLKMKIEHVNKGQLLSSIKLCFAGTSLQSIITQEASSQMDLKEGDEVVALIKASELSIVEVK